MAIMATKKAGGSYELCPAGTYSAICIGVYDLGIQVTNFGMKHQVVIRWEIDKRMEQEGEYKGKRFNQSHKYTLSLHEKAILYKHLVSWRGKTFTEDDVEFDVEQMLGQPCLLTVVHSHKGENTYANIESVSGLPEGMQPITRETDTSEIPKWIKELQGKQVGETHVERPVEQSPAQSPDDIPF